MDNTTMDTLVIDIQSTSTDATVSIDKLTKSLENLRNSLTGVVNASKGLTSLRNIAKVGASTNIKVKQPDRMQKVMDNVKVAPAFDNISAKNLEIQRSTSNLIVGYDELNNNLQKIGTSYKDLIPIQVIEQGKNSIQKLKATSGEVVIVTKKMKNGFATFDTTIKSTSPQVKTLNDRLNSLQQVMSSVQVKVLAVGTAMWNMAKKSISFVKQASEEAEAVNLFTVTMGKYAEEGTEWIKKFSDALYLDKVSVMQYMGSFNSLVKGLGVGAENSYLMSKNLTQLVYDFSSFKNISIESAYEKLISGISGELEPIRNQGVAMSEATLQTLAYELGIEKLVREMTEAEKAQLRYIQIMRSTSDWQTDMGRTIITPANALRVLQQQFIQLGRAIGKVFIPIVMELMPYVIALTQVITAFAERLAKFFGYVVPDIDYSKLGDISAGITDIGNSASDATKKLNTMLAPFDDLNVVQTNKQKDGSGLAGIGGDLGVILPEYDALANLNTKFAEGVEDAKKNLEKLLPVVVAIGVAFATWKVATGVLDTVTSISNISTALSNITPMSAKKWSKILGGGLVTAIGGVIASIGVGLGWSAIKQALEDNGWDKESLKTYGIGTGLLVIGGFLIGAGIALATGGAILTGGLIGAIAAAVIAALAFLITTVVTHWEDIKKGWNEFWVDIDNKLDTAKEDISKKWDEMWVSVGNWFDQEKQSWSDNWTTFTETASGMWSVMADDISTTWDETWVTVGNTFDTIKEEWSTKMTELKTNISDTWDETWVNVGNTLETKWTKAKTWFGDHFGTKEDWKNIFKSLTDGATEKLDELKTKFENWKANIKTPHFEWSSKDSFKVTGWMKDALDALNLPTSIPKLKINWYQDGGYPTSGDLFFANENGIPEMVGRIGHQTAVANNDQIATSITNALITALDQYDFGGGKSPTIIYIGNKKVYEGYGDYVSDENDRYGTNVIKI